jgi:hypothetical protein
VVDFAPGQSHLAVLLDAGLSRLYAMEWRPATAATRDVTNTDYLDVIERAVIHAGAASTSSATVRAGGWRPSTPHCTRSACTR